MGASSSIPMKVDKATFRKLSGGGSLNDSIFDQYAANGFLNREVLYQLARRIDCMIIHDWNFQNRNSSSRLSMLKDSLTSTGLTLLESEQEQEFSIKRLSKLCDDIDRSRCIIFVLTNSFCQAIQRSSPFSTLLLEVNFILRRKSSHFILPLIFESILPTESETLSLLWNSCSTRIDFTSESSHPIKCNEIFQSIVRLTRSPASHTFVKENFVSFDISTPIQSVLENQVMQEELYIFHWLERSSSISESKRTLFSYLIHQSGVGSLFHLIQKVQQNPKFLEELGLSLSESDQLIESLNKFVSQAKAQVPSGTPSSSTSRPHPTPTPTTNTTTTPTITSTSTSTHNSSGIPGLSVGNGMGESSAPIPPPHLHRGKATFPHHSKSDLFPPKPQASASQTHTQAQFQQHPQFQPRNNQNPHIHRPPNQTTSPLSQPPLHSQPPSQYPTQPNSQASLNNNNRNNNNPPPSQYNHPQFQPRSQPQGQGQGQGAQTNPSSHPQFQPRNSNPHSAQSSSIPLPTSTQPSSSPFTSTSNIIPMNSPIPSLPPRSFAEMDSIEVILYALGRVASDPADLTLALEVYVGIINYMRKEKSKYFARHKELIEQELNMLSSPQQIEKKLEAGIAGGGKSHPIQSPPLNTSHSMIPSRERQKPVEVILFDAGVPHTVLKMINVYNAVPAKSQSRSMTTFASSSNNQRQPQFQQLQHPPFFQQPENSTPSVNISKVLEKAFLLLAELSSEHHPVDLIRAASDSTPRPSSASHLTTTAKTTIVTEMCEFGLLDAICRSLNTIHVQQGPLRTIANGCALAAILAAPSPEELSTPPSSSLPHGVANPVLTAANASAAVSLKIRNKLGSCGFCETIGRTFEKIIQTFRPPPSNSSSRPQTVQTPLPQHPQFNSLQQQPQVMMGQNIRGGMTDLLGSSDPSLKSVRFNDPNPQWTEIDPELREEAMYCVTQLCKAARSVSLKCPTNIAKLGNVKLIQSCTTCLQLFDENPSLVQAVFSSLLIATQHPENRLRFGDSRSSEAVTAALQKHTQAILQGTTQNVMNDQFEHSQLSRYQSDSLSLLENMIDTGSRLISEATTGSATNRTHFGHTGACEHLARLVCWGVRLNRTAPSSYPGNNILDGGGINSRFQQQNPRPQSAPAHQRQPQWQSNQNNQFRTLSRPPPGPAPFATDPSMPTATSGFNRSNPMIIQQNQHLTPPFNSAEWEIQELKLSIQVLEALCKGLFSLVSGSLEHKRKVIEQSRIQLDSNDTQDIRLFLFVLSTSSLSSDGLKYWSNQTYSLLA